MDLKVAATFLIVKGGIAGKVGVKVGLVMVVVIGWRWGGIVVVVVLSRLILSP